MTAVPDSDTRIGAEQALIGLAAAEGDGRPAPAGEVEALRRAVRELSHLRDLARITASTLDRDELCAVIIRETCLALAVEVCSLYVVRGGDLVLAATNGLNPAGVGVARMPVGTGITGAAAARCDLVAVDDAARDPRFHWIDGLDEERFTSMCSVPLLSRDSGAVGVLNVQSVAPRRWSEDETATLTAIAAQLAGVIERAELQHRLDVQLAESRALVQASAALLAAGGRDEVESVLAQHAAAALGVPVSFWRRRGPGHYAPVRRERPSHGGRRLDDGIEDLVRSAVEARTPRRMIHSVTPAPDAPARARRAPGRTPPAPYATVLAVPAGAAGALVAEAPAGREVSARESELLETIARLGMLALGGPRLWG